MAESVYLIGLLRDTILDISNSLHISKRANRIYSLRNSYSHQECRSLREKKSTLVFSCKHAQTLWHMRIQDHRSTGPTLKDDTLRHSLPCQTCAGQSNEVV